MQNDSVFQATLANGFTFYSIGLLRYYRGESV